MANSFIPGTLIQDLTGTRNSDGTIKLAPAVTVAVESTPGARVTPYRTSGERRTFIRNGTTVNDFAYRSQTHDIFGSQASLINPLTGMSNIGYLNVGRQLAAIPGATSAPYWTDQTPLVYTYDAMVSSVPGQLDFVDGVCRVRCPAGYGDGAGARRRTQMNFEPLSARTRVRWEITLQIPLSDEGIYDAADADGMLLWQIKTSNAEPVLSLVTKPNVDGTLQLFVNHKWSGQVGDPATYRSQHNNNSAGVINANAGRTLVTRNIQKGVWYDVVIEAFLDERDLAYPSNGQGYVDVWLNNEQILAFSGPTLSIRGLGGAVPTTSVWTLGAYCYQAAVLDLNKQTDPAPRNREVWYAKGRMFLLEKQADVPILKTGTSTPVGSVTPDYVGQDFYASGVGSGTFFKAKGTTSADWIALN